jgi:hypothetical protein
MDAALKAIIFISIFRKKRRTIRQTVRHAPDKRTQDRTRKSRHCKYMMILLFQWTRLPACYGTDKRAVVDFTYRRTIQWICTSDLLSPFLRHVVCGAEKEKFQLCDGRLTYEPAWPMDDVQPSCVFISRTDHTKQGSRPMVSLLFPY